LSIFPRCIDISNAAIKEQLLVQVLNSKGSIRLKSLNLLKLCNFRLGWWSIFYHSKCLE